MPLVHVKEDETFENALRRFKRKCEKSGILSELKKRQHYEKPSTKRKRKAIAARKKVLRKQSPGMPDGLHFHMLVHKRLVRRYEPATPWANAATSPFLWALSLLVAAPAALFWDNTAVLQVLLISFVAFYAWLYWRIVRFRTPKLLIARQWFRSRRSTVTPAQENDGASPANADL